MNNCRHRRWSNGFFLKVLAVLALIGGWVFGSSEFFSSALVLAVLTVGQTMRCCQSECMMCVSEGENMEDETKQVYARKPRRK